MAFGRHLIQIDLHLPHFFTTEQLQRKAPLATFQCWDLNSKPSAQKSNALTTELPLHTSAWHNVMYLVLSPPLLTLSFLFGCVQRLILKVPDTQQAMWPEVMRCLTCRDRFPARLPLSVVPPSSPASLHSQTEGENSEGRHVRRGSRKPHNQMTHKTQIHFVQRNLLCFFFFVLIWACKITHYKSLKWMTTWALGALHFQQPFNLFLMKKLESNELPALFISIITEPVKRHTPWSPNY